MKGKQRCQILKEIRQKIADANDIEFITSECQHKGDCLGTCPKCEAELRYLERELEKRQRLGKTVVVAGLTAIIATSAVGCDDWFPRETGGDPLPPEGYEELDGDIALPENTQGLIELPDDGELGGDPAVPADEIDGEIPPRSDHDCAPDIHEDISADELRDALLGGVTREGLYNSLGWAELHVKSGDHSDTYRCPISTFDLLTVVHDEQGYIIDVQFADTQADTNDSAIILPESELP